MGFFVKMKIFLCYFFFKISESLTSLLTLITSYFSQKKWFLFSECKIPKQLHLCSCSIL